MEPLRRNVAWRVTTLKKYESKKIWGFLSTKLRYNKVFCSRKALPRVDNFTIINTWNVQWRQGSVDVNGLNWNPSCYMKLEIGF